MRPSADSRNPEELGYFDEKREKDQKVEVGEEGGNKDNLQNRPEEEQKPRYLIDLCLTRGII